VKAAKDALAKGQSTELKLGKAAKELGLESIGKSASTPTIP
jgi:hypothetical protein